MPSSATSDTSRDQTEQIHLEAPRNLLIIAFSHLSLFEAAPTHRPARAQVKLKAVTYTQVNNARATRHGRRNAPGRERLGGRGAWLFERFSGAEAISLRTALVCTAEDKIVAPENMPDKNVAPRRETAFEESFNVNRSFRSCSRVVEDKD